MNGVSPLNYLLAHETFGSPKSGVESGGETGGTFDHRELTNRDANGQHPIASITGLERELSKRLTEDSAMSVVDIIKIMEE